MPARPSQDPDLVAVVHFAAFCAAVCAGEAADAAVFLERLHDVVAELRDPQLRWAIGVLDAVVATMEGLVRRGRTDRGRHGRVGCPDRR